MTRQFLESKGWILIDEHPLFERFQHESNPNLRCFIGLYGEFSIAELHWINQTPDKEFSTINPDITPDEYNTILRLLNIPI
jgi:hypothetical protein